MVQIKKETKDQILERVTNQGVSVAEAAKDHGVTTRIIYKWMEGKAKRVVTSREHSKVISENKMLKTLLGELTVKLSVSQKKN